MKLRTKDSIYQIFVIDNATKDSFKKYCRIELDVVFLFVCFLSMAGYFLIFFTKIGPDLE